MLRTASIALAIAALAFAFALPHPSAQTHTARTAIVGGTVVNGTGGQPVADAVVLGDISIRKVAAVWKEGRAIDRERLPQSRVLSVVLPGPKPGPSSK
jgi:hypothetical protein